MKIEKINADKIKIFLSYDEINEWNLSIADFNKSAKYAQDFFIALFEETNLDLDFLDEDSQLLIEASINKDNLFVLTVTKIYNLPDIEKYSLVENELLNKLDNNYYTNANIYKFNDLQTLINFSKKAISSNLFCGINKLYKCNSYYLLVFKLSTIKNKSFFKTFILLSEFCNKSYIYKDIFNFLIDENCNLILKSNAIQKLANF